MTLEQAKAVLGDRHVLSPNYQLANNPQHSPFEPVNIRLTFAHFKHGQDFKHGQQRNAVDGRNRR